MLQIADPDAPPSRIPPLLRLAFRPFFLFGALFACLSIGWWTIFWVNPAPWSPYGNATWWHAHEMIFGFGAAIVTGFLLTAVQTWTGVKGLNGAPLAVLVILWLCGRVLLLNPAVLPGHTLQAIVPGVLDTSFLLFAAVAMAYPVFKVRQTRNIPFPFILLLFAGLNGLSHYGVMVDDLGISMNTLHAGIMVIMLLVTIVGGRVIPFFTANATDHIRRPNVPVIEIAAIGSFLLLVAVALSGLRDGAPLMTASICFIGAAAHAIRLYRWGWLKTFKTPLLWSLHAAYLFIPMGLIALGLWATGMIQDLSPVLHMFTVGAMGTIILAMITRVSLGHTGRPLIPPKPVILAYFLVILSALVRVLVPLTYPEFYSIGIVVAGVAWASAFGLFLISYTAILATPRIDNQPG